MTEGAICSYSAAAVSIETFQLTTVFRVVAFHLQAENNRYVGAQDLDSVRKTLPSRGLQLPVHSISHLWQVFQSHGDNDLWCRSACEDIYQLGQGVAFARLR